MIPSLRQLQVAGSTRLLRGCTAVLLMVLATQSRAATTQLESLRIREAPDYTRVVLDVSAPVEFSIFTLDNPRRVVVDIANARAASGFDPAQAAAGRDRVKAVRTAARGDGTRVVLEVSGPVDPKGFPLAPTAPYGHRLVVDLHGAGAADGAAVVSKPKTRANGRRDIVIAIDAGHGGEDPGALSPNGALEKQVVMQIARRLEKKLAAAPGFKPVMVRTGDYYLAHRKRFAVARDSQADLFVSIHADAFRLSEVSGASVYALSTKGINREKARWFGKEEQNLVLLGGDERISLTEQSDHVVNTIVDLTGSGSLAISLDVGSSILQQMGSVTKLHKKRVEQAGFLVLKAIDVPSVLVETGFISNPAEARRLQNTDFQNKLATAISDGIRDYMATNPPDGTLLAWQRAHGEQRYTISRGDTLSEIASRHGVTTRRIKEANGMRNDVIRVGQVITIPAG